MYKVEVGKGPLMFMSYSRIIEEITKESKVKEIEEGIETIKEIKDSFYAILYDFGMPIGCGRLIINTNIATIDNISIFKEHNTNELKKDIKTQLLKKAIALNLEVEK